jgi:alpha-tubulin suppressor-like RCC1 family protein
MTSGGVKCCGLNNHGQLGDGTTTDRSTPVDVSGLTSDVVSINAGVYYTCVVTTSGGAKCWGIGIGTSANDDYLPEELTSSVASIDPAHTYTCALSTSGGVSCAHGYTSGEWSDVEGLTSGVASISAGTNPANFVGYLGCAVTTSGGAKCWGKNSSGQLGNGTTTDSPTPVDVSGLTSGVASISAGGSTVCAVTTSGGAKCWGSNSFGELGNGTATSGQASATDDVCARGSLLAAMASSVDEP